MMCMYDTKDRFLYAVGISVAVKYLLNRFYLSDFSVGPVCNDVLTSCHSEISDPRPVPLQSCNCNSPLRQFLLISWSLFIFWYQNVPQAVVTIITNIQYLSNIMEQSPSSKAITMLS
jgi:hypothetical protein